MKNKEKRKFVFPQIIVIKLENTENICAGSANTQQYIYEEDYNPWQ